MSSEGPGDDASKCTGCGYELRGLEREASCPECGLPIRTTRAVRRARWTPAIGIRRALLYEIGCGLLFAGAFFGLLWWLGPLMREVPDHTYVLNRRFVVPGSIVLSIIPIVLLWHLLKRVAGFTGTALAVSAVASVAIASAGAATAVVTLGRLSTVTATIIVGTIVVTTTLWLIRDVYVDGRCP